MTTIDAAIEELLTSPPTMHWAGGAPQPWGIDSNVLEWLADHIEADWRTLETGCGVSSLLFALRAASHTIVAPGEQQHERVRAWCAERGFSTAHVQSVVEPSQTALPMLPMDAIDLALIDGGHAFPLPFIDWYYMSVRLRVGGYLIVDDMHIRSCRLLRDFLATEHGRWRLEADLSAAAVFKKLDEVVIPQNDWVGQRWCRRAPALDRLRARIGLRTRLRAARSRWMRAMSSLRHKDGS
jgi:hypothetical protein